jgi:hypothetical protein
VGDNAADRWQAILAEYAIARAAHRIAYDLLTGHPTAADNSKSPEFVAESDARARLLAVLDRMTVLEGELSAPSKARL